MQSKKFLAVIFAMLAAGSAFAQQTEFVAPDAGFKSSRTRAEVAAEVQQAYAQGTLVTNDAYPFPSSTTSTSLTRQQVRDELVKSATAGEKLSHSAAENINGIYFGG